MSLRTPIAWRNIAHKKVRSLVALSGVSFAVFLVFMQSGFYFAVLTSATAVYRSINADVFLTSPLYVYLGRTGVIPRERLYEASGIDGVQDATAFYADTQLWRNPVTRLRHPMLVMGFDPARDVLNAPANTTRLFEDGQILIDSLTREQFGPQDTGVTTEIGNQQVHIAGQYRIGPGFATDGAAIMSDETFVRSFTNHSVARPSIGLLRAKPGASIQQIAEALRRKLPADTQVLTRDEMIAREERYWIRQTSIGPVFASGAVLGLIIGIVIVYQVVVTDIANRLREYATLKAIGYNLIQLQAIVLKEVSIFAVLGFTAGALLSAGLYNIVRNETGLPMILTLRRSAAVFVFTLLMCGVAGLLATRKLRQADPADLC